MKKRFFNVTIGGYYVVSVILGIAMALTVGMMVMDAWSYALDCNGALHSRILEEYGLPSNSNSLSGLSATEETDAAWAVYESRDEFLDEVWSYLPMTGLYGLLYESNKLGAHNYAPVVLTVSAIVTVFLSVMIMEGKSANKAWRQKMHQACGWWLLILLMDLAAWYARRRMFGWIPTGVVLVPVVLLIIPILILKKTRIRGEKPVTKLEHEEMPMPRPGDREPIKG